MKAAREQARREQERIRIEVMTRITQGSEAARIQAEAELRAKTLRMTAYRAATAQAESLKAAYRIQQEAMITAR